MSLVVTQITDKGILFFTDRRISKGVKRVGEYPKFLPISKLNAGLCYFGVAQVKGQLLSEWLRNFITKDASTDLEQFARNLSNALEKEMTKIEKEGGTGIQIAGYIEVKKKKIPSFWFVRNITGMQGFAYLKGDEKFTYSEDFLQRDVKDIPIESLQLYLKDNWRIYRNGFLFPYTYVDAFMRSIRKALPEQDSSVWKVSSTLEDYALDGALALEIVVQLFKRFGKYEPVGGSIEIHAITEKGIFDFDKKTKKLKTT